jgi:hypothetical protein
MVCPRLWAFFFSSGQRWRFHLWMAASLRSKARPAGRCGVQPMARNTRQAWTVEYFTPHSPWIRSATRQAVQRPVRYPRASGPRFRPVRCAADRRSIASGADPRGVPASTPAARLPLRPWPSGSRTVDARRRGAPLRLPARPVVGRRTPCRRRRSNFTRSRLTPAGCPMPEYTQNIHLCHYIM